MQFVYVVLCDSEYVKAICKTYNKCQELINSYSSNRYGGHIQQYDIRKMELDKPYHIYYGPKYVTYTNIPEIEDKNDSTIEEDELYMLDIRNDDPNKDCYFVVSTFRVTSNTINKISKFFEKDEFYIDIEKFRIL